MKRRPCPPANYGAAHGAYLSTDAATTTQKFCVPATPGVQKEFGQPPVKQLAEQPAAQKSRTSNDLLIKGTYMYKDDDDEDLSFDEMYPSSLKRADDIPANGLQVRIKRVFKQVVNQTSGEEKWCLEFFDDPVPMSLNKTNGKTLCRLFGKTAPKKDWPGHEILLVAEDVSGPQGTTLGIRIKQLYNQPPAKPLPADTAGEVHM
jgi:hypothetical protein